MNTTPPHPVPSGRRLRARGFSLIEILVVVAIIGVLAAILLPALNKALQAAHVNRTIADLKQLKGFAADAANQLGGTLPLTAGYGYAAVSRLECAAVDAAQLAGTADVNGGTNFRVDGVNSLPAGRVAYAVIKGVAGPDAAQIASAIDAPAFMDDTSGAAETAQTRGEVAYAAAVSGVTDVYVYLGNF